MFHFFKQAASLSPQEAAMKIQEPGAGFIDVRTVREYAGGHARGAKNIPLDTLEERIEEVRSFEKVYVICQSGGRSSEAVGYLSSQGIHAINVSGGTTMWKLLGLAMQ